PFVLSQDITPGYDHDISVMRLVVRREDLTRVKDIVSRHAAEIVSELFRGSGPVDIVQTLTRKVPVRLADEYFGFSAPHDEQMMAWARSCFREFFINLFNDPLVRAPAAAAKADDDDALSDLIFEALRFRPINPMVVRVAKEDYSLAAGEQHQTLIRKGTTVFALTWSAMFDPRVLQAPEEFRPDRPDYHYMHFATGRHACYGRYISRIQVPQILKPLLKLEGLRATGAPEYDGTFPETLRVAADI